MQSISADQRFASTAEQIGSNLIVDLGVHSEDDTASLLKQATALGLDASLISPEGYITDQGERRFEPFGSPVSVGDPGEETTVIPFGWILIGVLLIAM